MKLEGEAVMRLNAENSVVSLSGSNPLHPQSMQHIQELGIVVYIDVNHSDILERLHEMKASKRKDSIVALKVQLSKLCQLCNCILCPEIVQCTVYNVYNVQCIQCTIVQYTEIATKEFCNICCLFL